MNQNLSLVEIQKEVATELANKETLKTLVATTFKGLNEAVVPQAIVEGMIRGFSFKDFLERNIYAIPFKNGYGLVTSIDWARKIGMRSGVTGKSAPSFQMDGDKVVSCTITIKRKVGDQIGEFTDTAYFDEYYRPGRENYPSLWDTKPRTMIAKVAEMHALRMACPEELSQSYVEEEVERDIKPAVQIDMNAYGSKLESASTREELGNVWAALPPEAKVALFTLKETLKKKYETGAIHG